MQTGQSIRLEFERGQLVVRGWPPGLAPPPPLQPDADGALRGPARLRGPVRRLLLAAGLPFVDAIAAPAVALPTAPPLPSPLAAMLAAMLDGGGERPQRNPQDLPLQAIHLGLPLAARASLTHAAACAHRVATWIVVPDTGAVAAWHRELAPRLGPALGSAPGAAAIAVATAAAAAWEIGRLGARHELLVVDDLDLLPAPRFAAVVDGSAALHRLGFAAGAAGSDLLQRTVGLGPVVAALAAGAPECIELRLPLAAAERQSYEVAWHEFFAAFDQFAALRPTAAFGEFVRWARSDPTARPALLAWHRCVRAASWTAAKAAATAQLLARHRADRVLLFTPDRASAYELARQHLIMPVTAELPRRERDAALAAFARGSLRALVGPRLLETGAPEGLADVGVLIGCSMSLAQRRARCRRIAAAGVCYELVSRDTLEVGRARRLRGAAPAATAALD